MYAGYYQPYWIDSDELEHYGILGMKWGIRRYQNKDGTLTEAGKKRYAGATQEQIETSERRKAKVKKVVKTAAKTSAKIAAYTIASGVAFRALANTPAGKTAVAAGIQAITDLIDPPEARASRRKDMSWIPGYMPSPFDSSQKSSGSWTEEEIITSILSDKKSVTVPIGNILVDSIPDLKKKR